MDDKVDPNLFVTCRLCLEDLGQYQIVPKVQQQIKYCFNIDVSTIIYYSYYFYHQYTLLIYFITYKVAI